MYLHLHSVLKEKVTGIDGGTALLLALGFTLKIDPEPDREVVKGVVGVFSSAGGLIAPTRPVETIVSVTGSIFILRSQSTSRLASKTSVHPQRGYVCSIVYYCTAFIHTKG